MSKFEPGIGREFPMEESAPRGHRGFCGKHRPDGHAEHAHHQHGHSHAHHHGHRHGCRHGHGHQVAE